MRRREFITLLAGAAAWPCPGRAQQPDRVRRIGVLMGYAESDSDAQARIAAFRDGLQKLGWAEGRNIQIDTRWPIPADLESMQRFAKELVALQPDVILSHITPTTAAVLQQTRTIPIVFATVADPVGSGFVASFSRPGGNVTGFTSIEPTMAGKWLELLKEIAPRVARVAFLFNPVTAPYAEYFLNPLKAAALSFRVEAIAAPVRDKSELESIVAAQAREPNSGLIVTPDSFTHVHRAEITSLAARHRLPAVYPFRQYPHVGGLLSYGNDEHDNFRQLGASKGDAIPGWTLHDLRRTAATGMARLNIPPHVVDKVLNHVSGTIRGVAAVYNRFAYLDERRAALGAWGFYVTTLLQPTTSNVVNLRS